MIQVICDKCGFVYHEYVIGSSGNKNKYIGPPTPEKAVSGFDGRTCPICSKPASVSRPRRVLFMTEKEYESKAKVIEVRSKDGSRLMMKFVIIEGIDEIYALRVKSAIEESAAAMYPGVAGELVHGSAEAGDGVLSQA